ncbi:hypothetical protein L6452_17144 [Arctium lappa]|uniref:Uncharacterized protein n=1 Tax=Arctium lappa TaxID=4217 RepID=A0ACB9C2G9_ARCLA|nr:hypothetical protein L6452_17144 [Arctium lappa]
METISASVRLFSEGRKSKCHLHFTSMWVPLIRSVSRRNLGKKHDLVIRFSSVSSLAQLTFSDVSDSSSDENCPFPHKNNSTNSIDHAHHVFDKNTLTETLYHLERKPKTALFLITHLKECGFMHDVVTYMAIIRFFCYWGMMKRLKFLFLEVIEDKSGVYGFEVFDLFEELLKEINVDDKNLLVRAVDALVKAFIRVHQFDEAYDVLLKIQGGYFPSVLTCNLLMNVLVEEGKVDMAMMVYQHLKMKGFVPNVYTYGIVVKGLCRTGCVNEAGDVFNSMKEAGVEPNAFTFGSYIDGLCSNGYTDSGFKLLKMLRETGSLIDVFAYASVIRGFVKELKLQDAENVFFDMKQAAIVPDAYCYGALIQGYCQRGDILKALDIHDEMCSKGININCVIMSSIMQCLGHLGMSSEAVYRFTIAMESGVFLDEISFNIAIDALCKLGKMAEAMTLLEEMKHKNMNPDAKHYTTLINGYCLQKDLQNALTIFDEMNEKGMKPDTVTFNVLVGAFSKCGLFKETMILLDNMLALGLEPTSATHNIVIEGLCKGGKAKEAEAFFNILERKSLSNYVAMMNGYCDTKNVRKAYELFLKLSKDGKEGILVAKAPCCSKLLSCLCEEGETEKALMLFKTILVSDNGPSKIMYSKLQSAYCQAGDIRMARWVFDMMIARGLMPDVINYTIMLNGYFRASCLTEANDLFIDMINHGIQPDVITYTVLFDGESKVKRKSLTRGESGRDERGLSRYLTKLQEFVPDQICYTVLIDYFCKSNNLEAAIWLFKKMIDRGLQPDTIAYTSLIRGYCYEGFVEKAKTLHHKMVAEGVQPDSHTMRVLETVKGKKMRVKKDEAMMLGLPKHCVKVSLVRDAGTQSVRAGVFLYFLVSFSLDLHQTQQFTGKSMEAVEVHLNREVRSMDVDVVGNDEQVDINEEPNVFHESGCM